MVARQKIADARRADGEAKKMLETVVALRKRRSLRRNTRPVLFRPRMRRTTSWRR